MFEKLLKYLGLKKKDVVPNKQTIQNLTHPINRRSIIEEVERMEDEDNERRMREIDEKYYHLLDNQFTEAEEEFGEWLCMNYYIVKPFDDFIEEDLDKFKFANKTNFEYVGYYTFPEMANEVMREFNCSKDEAVQKLKVALIDCKFSSVVNFL